MSEKIPVLGWPEFRARNYRFQPDPEDVARWERERRVIIWRRVFAGSIVASWMVLLPAMKPIVTQSFWLQGGTVAGFLLAMVAVGRFWQNPYRWTTSSGRKGDCTERSH